MASTVVDWKKAKVTELREELTKRGLDASGLKAALVERLEAADKAVANSVTKAGTGTAPSKSDQAQVAEKPEDGKNKPSIQQNGVAAESAKKGEKGEAKKQEEQDAGGSDSTPAAVKTGPTSDLEKKQQRAERFGVKLEMSESEKAKLRAERFGLPVAATDDAKKAVRAARFGGAVASGNNGIVDDAEEAKRKKRAERFGVVEPEAKKPKAGATSSKVDDAEEERRRKRAERFGALSKTQAV